MKKVSILLVIFLILPAVVFASYSDFQIVGVTVYSNLKGDSYAKVTVRNISSGSRIIGSGDFVGIFADGAERRGSGSSSVSVNPGETDTVMVEFGNYKWPLESVKLSI
mgnify:CR=1 FL=1